MSSIEMHSELLNLYLFASAMAKAALLTGFAPGIAALFLFNKFGTGALRPEQSESGHVRGSNLRFVSDSLSASSMSSGDGQLANKRLDLIPVVKLNLATSPSRKVSHA
jgi:hypothetical protein